MSKSLKGGLPVKASFEDKIAYKTMLLTYQFEHGVNLEERIIRLSGDVNKEMFEKLDEALTEMESVSKADITIKINSEGGDVHHALAIVGRIRESKCGIITKGYGCIMSSATLILASGTRKRMISEYAEFMHHESSYEVGGKHSEVKALTKHMEAMEKLWYKTMANFSNKTEKFWSERGVGTDAYFTPQQLLSFGVIDEIF